MKSGKWKVESGKWDNCGEAENKNFQLSTFNFQLLSARTWVEIDRSALLHNLAAIRTAVGANTEILAVVKADAYGHGALEVARTIADEVAYFGVACLDEALPLLPLEREIVILSPCLPTERAEAVACGVIVTVSSADEARAFAQHIPQNSQQETIRITLKIDTGMGRVGCLPEHTETAVREILADPRIALHGIATHLSAADEDDPFTQKQLAEFARLHSLLSPLAPNAKWHAFNSAGIFLSGKWKMESGKLDSRAYDATSAEGGKDNFPLSLVRAGLALYGIAEPSVFQNRLRPALTWKARVALVRDLPAGHTISYGHTHTLARPTRTAIISLGYADGFPRFASHKAHVLIGGRRCPVLGRITMDQIVVDTTDVSGTVRPGDEVVIIGKQGDEEILVTDLAAAAGTIAWEIFTGIHGRIKRFFH